MLSRKVRGLIMLSGVSALGGPGYATQPPDTVATDAANNTAMGTDALLNLTTGGADCTGYRCWANTGAGKKALYSLTIANSNTAFGSRALMSNTTGLYNVAVGSNALVKTAPVGSSFVQNANGNTGVGAGALYGNTNGYYNTAVGAYALLHGTTGKQNTACGAYAMMSASGSYNTATGAYALHSPNTSIATNTGSNNTASGFKSMVLNTTGVNNTAFGSEALYDNATGGGNSAQGYEAMYSNTTGSRNTGIGNFALYNNGTGSYNTALGFNAGHAQTTGTDNIYVDNVGVAGESHVMRLGTEGSAGTEGSGVVTAYIAGVATTKVTGSAVYITAGGQLGVLASSERYKTNIEPLGAASDRITQLRPVSFELRNDPDGLTQYGLIAEEVAKIYPEIVIHGPDGRIEGVRYEELTPLLLNVVQRQETKLAADEQRLAEEQARNATQAQQVAALSAQVEQLREAVSAALGARAQAPGSAAPDGK
jgi:trimeric autotransporter adhesin